MTATTQRYPLTAPAGLDLDAVARRGGVHPELVRRLVALGLLDARVDAAGRWRFPADTPARIARIQRLRYGLALNYAAIGLVLDLLERIAQLEIALHRSDGVDRPRSAPRWT